MAKKEKISLTETGYIDQIAESYYTPKEAQKRLGMDRDRFNNLVKNHVIGRRAVPGTHGHFLKKEINALAAKIEYALLTADNSELDYRFAVHSDLKAITDMAAMNFGEGVYKPERMAARRHFLEINPQSTIVLLDHGTIVASIDFVPLRTQAIQEFREGKRGWLFLDDIEQFDSSHRLECIIIDMMTTTNAPMSQRQHYAALLLRKFGNETLVDWARQGVDIKSIDACGGTLFGKRILRKAGFTNLGVKLGTRDMYKLDIDKSNHRLLEPYKNALTDWQNRR